MAKGKARKRFKLAESQNWRCCYCGGHLHQDGTRLDGATIEHVVLRAKGGSNCGDNLVAACLACNQARAGFYSAKIFYKLRLHRLRKGEWPPCTEPRKNVRKWMEWIFVEAEMRDHANKRRERRRAWALVA